MSTLGNPADHVALNPVYGYITSSLIPKVCLFVETINQRSCDGESYGRIAIGKLHNSINVHGARSGWYSGVMVYNQELYVVFPCYFPKFNGFTAK